MPAKKGGKKNKRAKRKPVVTDEQSRFVPTANNNKGQMYALAIKMLGSRRLTVKCADGKQRLAIIPGKFKGRRNWISVGMLLMLNIRDFQDDKADVIYIYSPVDAKRLQRNGDLDALIDKDDEANCGFVFGGVEENAEATADGADAGEEFDSEEEIDLEDL